MVIFYVQYTCMKKNHMLHPKLVLPQFYHLSSSSQTVNKLITEPYNSCMLYISQNEKVPTYTDSKANQYIYKL